MRLLSALAVVPLALAQQQQQPLQVYLHPTPAHLQTDAAAAIPTLTPDQARAVLAHHLGENIGDFDEIPNDEGLWSHLMGMWDGKNGEIGAARKARVVIVDGGVQAQDVLPTSLPSEPSFLLDDSSSTLDLLEPYLNGASQFFQDLADSIPALAKAFKDTFEMAGTKAAEILGHELSCLTAMADAIPWVDTSNAPWNAINISGLKNVDKDGEVWETGREGVKAGLASMTTPDSPPLLLIIRPDSASSSSSSSSYYTKRSSMALVTPMLKSKNGNTTLAESCYKSNETCSAATACNDRGACALKGKSGDDECWGCKCASGYAGVECQKDDYSVSFAIIVFSTLFLLITAGGSVMLLMTIGDTKLPSTLNLAIGTNMKRD